MLLIRHSGDTDHTNVTPRILQGQTGNINILKWELYEFYYY